MPISWQSFSATDAVACMQFAVQIAVIFSKIARFDYSREWPLLFNDLLGRLSTGDTLTIRRVYFILHHILKELSTKRLLADQRVFAQVRCCCSAAVMCQWRPCAIAARGTHGV